MKNLSKSLIAFLLSFVLLISACLPVFAVESAEPYVVAVSTGTQPTKYSSEYNSGERGVVATTLDGTSAASYYGTTYAYDVLDV